MGLDGRPPIIGLCLAVTFGLYGVIRKRMGIDPVTGIFVGMLVVMPLAAGYLIWMVFDGQLVFYGGGLFNILLALFAGVITVVPLLLYHAGNRDLPLPQPAFCSTPILRPSFASVFLSLARRSRLAMGLHLV